MGQDQNYKHLDQQQHQKWPEKIKVSFKDSKQKINQLLKMQIPFVLISIQLIIEAICIINIQLMSCLRVRRSGFLLILTTKKIYFIFIYQKSKIKVDIFLVFFRKYFSGQLLNTVKRFTFVVADIVHS